MGKRSKNTHEKIWEEKDVLKVKIEKPKLENIDLKKQFNDFEVSREDGKISSKEDIKEKIKRLKNHLKTTWN